MTDAEEVIQEIKKSIQYWKSEKDRFWNIYMDYSKRLGEYETALEIIQGVKASIVSKKLSDQRRTERLAKKEQEKKKQSKKKDTPLIEPVGEIAEPKTVTEIIPEIIPEKKEEIFQPEPTLSVPMDTGIPVTENNLKICMNSKCGKSFKPKTKRSKYCSSKCYQQDYMHEYWKDRTKDKVGKVIKKSLTEYVKSVTAKRKTVTKEPGIVPEEPIIVPEPVVGIASVIEPPSCALCHKPTTGRRHITDVVGNEFCNSDCQSGWNILHKSDSDSNGGAETKEQIHERIMKYEREHPLPKSPQRR